MSKMVAELCINYTTSMYPLFNPVCKLGFKAGLWCHKYDSKHYCNRYQWEVSSDK